MRDEAIRYIYGDQHAGRPRKKGWEYPVINRAYPDILQEMAILTANNPSIAGVPREDTDIPTAQAVSEVLKGLWENDLHMRAKIMQGILDDHTWGVKVAKWYWEPRVKWDQTLADETGNGWRGKIRVDIIDPDTWGCDPELDLGLALNERARFVYTDRWVDKAWAAQRWGEYRKHLEDKGEVQPAAGGDVSIGGPTTDERGFNRDTFAFVGKSSPSSSINQQAKDEEVQRRLSDLILNDPRGGGKNERTADNSVRIQEIYFKDYSTIRVPAQQAKAKLGIPETAHIIKLPDSDDPQDYDSNKPINDAEGNVTGYELVADEDWPMVDVVPAYDRPKYPNGRVVVRIHDGKGGEWFKVVDEAWMYEKWPFSVTPMYILPHTWRGVNGVELSQGLQDILNLIASHMLNWVKFHSDPVTLLEEGALAPDKGSKRGVIRNFAGAINKFRKGALAHKRFVREPPAPMGRELFEINRMFADAHQDIGGIQDVGQGRASTQANTLGELQMLNRNTRQRIALQGAMLDEWIKEIGYGIVALMQRHYRVGDYVQWAGADASTAVIEWSQEMADAKFDIQLKPVSTIVFDEEREARTAGVAFEAAGPAALEQFLKKLGIEKIDEILTKHEIIGPLMALMEAGAKEGMGPPQIMAAIQAQMQMLQGNATAAPTGPGGPAGAQPPGGQPPAQQPIKPPAEPPI